MAHEFILKSTDEVPIKADISQTPWTKIVSDIVEYGANKNLGNAFMLLDVGSSFAGLIIRYFNITSNTAYLATKDYINDANMIGIYSEGMTNPSTSTYWIINWSGAIGIRYSSVNFLQRTRDGINYSCGGSNTSGYANQQAIYLPPSVTNIYIDGSPLVSYQWSSVPTISGKNGVLSLPVLIDTDGNPVSNGSASDFSTLPDSVKVRTLADLAVQ